jgi:hypothetical protein
MRRSILSLTAALVLLASAATVALAVTIDGQLDPEYGTPIAVQTSQTVFPDATSGRLGPANGGEIDAMHAYIADNALHVFVAGNMWTEGNPVDYGLFFTSLHLFVDTGAGGQNTISAFMPSGLIPPNGLQLDAGFAPGYWFGCYGTLANYYDPSSAYTLNAWGAVLLPAGSASSTLLGRTGPGGPGTLAGGANPDGILLAIDNTNVGGVTQGCGAASGAGVTTGVEWSIPLSAIGNPAGCVNICALLARSGSLVSSQVLPPLPANACNSITDFTAYEGNQYIQVCPSGVPVRTSTWGALKSAYR